VAAGLALGSVPAAAAALAIDAFGQDHLPGIIVEVLNFALMLDHLEAEFYTPGKAASGLRTGRDCEMFDQIRKHEVPLSRRCSRIRERAYKGQAFFLMANKAVLQSALRIHSVETRHAAQVRELRGGKGRIVWDSRRCSRSRDDPDAVIVRHGQPSPAERRPLRSGRNSNNSGRW
jgi:hypothetical protein